MTSLDAQLPAAKTAGASPSGLWREADEPALLAARGSITAAEARRGVVPSSYRTLHLDRALLAARLAGAPKEFSAIARSANPPAALEIELPIPHSARYARFAVEESPIMEAGLAARYPEIRTYAAHGIDNPALVARLDVTPQGFHALIFTPGGEIFIDPYFADGADQSTAIAYYRRDYAADKPWQCFVPEPALPPTADVLARASTAALQRPSGASLRTYRLALAATGEYTAAAGGGTVAGALAAMVTTVNRVDGVYEKDFAIRLVLVNNTDQLIYTNAGADPYTNNNGGTMLGENQSNVDSIIGNANYDIGHVFSTGGGGIAAVGVVCVAGFKAEGVTGSSNPTGDGYDIDYVAHEMGHQFNASHTFNATTGGCNGNRTASTAYEPGSGVTIMAYAGVCNGASVQDLAPHSVDIFHSVSYDQIDSYTTTGAGKNAFSTTATGNTPPVIAAPTAYTIPISTPFALTASATDADGDTLTYCWEEFDLGDPVNATNAGSLDNGASPIFRSYQPAVSPTRYFPSLTYILNNANVPPLYDADGYLTGETLPTKARTNGLNFRCTVRDNHSGGGGSNYAAVKLAVAPGAGPFVVTAPNAAASFVGGTAQTVAWNVANTTAAPVSCANVSISLSTDGGLTFPFVLAASAPNTGSASVVLPNVANVNTVKGRIKVQAVDNIFFDIDDADLTITANTSAPTFTGNGKPLTLVRGTTAATSAVVGSATPGSSALTGVSVSNVPVGVTLAASLVNGNSVSFSGVADCQTAVTATTRTFTVNVTVTDAAGATGAGVVNVVVQPDPAPTLGIYAATTIVQGDTAAVSPSAGPADPNFNLAPNPFGVTPASLPGGGTITVDQTTGTVTVASTAASTAGTFLVNVTCQDDCGAVATKSFNLKITSATAGNPPTITGTLAANATVGSAFSYQVTAANSPTTYSANGLPAGLAIDASTGLISGTPLQTGTFSVDLRVTNAEGSGTASLTLTIVPLPVIPAPVITSAGAGTPQAGKTYSYQITATNSPTAFSATGLPQGLSVDVATGLISGTPTQAGAYAVTLSASNAGGAGTAALTLTVAPAPLPAPVITSVLTANGQQEQPFSYQIVADNSPTSYGSARLPAGLAIDAATGLISGVPTVFGNYDVTVSATNATGTGTASLTLLIAAPPLPEITVEATAKNAVVGGTPGFITVRRTGDLSAPLTVYFLLKGSGKRGVDFQLLPTHKKIKAGKAERTIRINGRGDLGGRDKKVVKVVIAPNDAYTVGAIHAAKVKIFPGQ